jgi:TonB-linked SusC/RagA family outer membrane protein
MKRVCIISILFLAIGFNNVFSQQITVSGQVSDAQTGDSMPGVNISVKGTTTGTSTDADGNFSLNVPTLQDTLVFSFIGYNSSEEPINGRSTINVSLEQQTIEGQELIVVGYGEQDERDLTGAISRVSPEDFSPGTNTNAVQLLNGNAAGVNVSQVSSAPGGGIKIQIRGAGSINSSNDVLFVVDGLPGVDPSSLSPNDIESIEVLKDASAASIYGTRAANGVVLVTTKSGGDGETQFSYSTYFGIQQISEQLDVLGGANYMRLINLRGNDPVYSDQEIAAIGSGTNWQDQIFETAPIQNHQLSVSGGNENSSYYVGLNYFDQDGIVESSSNKKYNARLNIDSNPLEKLKISLNVNYTREDTKEILFSNAANDFAGPINTAIQFDPTLPPELNENGRYFLNPTIALDNPVALIKGIDDDEVSKRFYGSLNADYEIMKNLTATIRLGAESNEFRSDFYRSRITDIGRSNNGNASVNSQESTHWLTEYLLRYQSTFSENHDISVQAGATYEVFESSGIGASSAGFLSDVTGTDLLQSGDGELRDNVSSYRFKNQLNGFLGRVNYGFDNRYLLTASVRADGSSRFSDDEKYAVFPSASVGWRISEEQFMDNVNWVNELKLRVGYGVLGNQGINNFETIQTLVAGGSSVFGGSIAQGVVPARLPNPNLRWETTAEYNIGLDYSLVNDRISGSIDYFNRTTSDQLFVKPLPSVVGFSSVRTNLGEVKNTGVDFSLQTQNMVGDFNWNSSLTLSFLRNEVTELPDFTQQIIGGNIGTFISNYTIVREGDPLRSYYGYQIDGIFQEGDDIENAPTPDVNGYAPGMPKFVDQNGDGNIDGDDRVILGDPFPDLSFGFKNSFYYKNLSFDVFIHGVKGIETLDANVTESLYPTNDFRNSISRYYLDRWTPENPSNELPSGMNPSLYGGARAINSLTVVDASYARLKNITLGYNFPLSGSTVFSSLRAYIAAENLLTITDYEGYDPDASAAGSGNVVKVNYNSYPLARTFRLGIDIQF